MFKRFIAYSLIASYMTVLFTPTLAKVDSVRESKPSISTMDTMQISLPNVQLDILKPVPVKKEQKKITKAKPKKTVTKKDPKMNEKDIRLIALVTMAEAEGESEEGKRLVIDTILNRVDSKHFPNTVHEVIYQPNQFESMWNGRVDRCHVKEDICQLVKEELKSQKNYDVMFFTAGQYSQYGKRMFRVGNHYFSSYD